MAPRNLPKASIHRDTNLRSEGARRGSVNGPTGNGMGYARPTTTKKAKRLLKHNHLISRLQESSGKISKTAKKRQNRRAASSLTTNLKELESMLPSQEDAAEKEKATRLKRLASSNSNAKKRDRVVMEEMDRFQKVLAQEDFRKDPFGSIRLHLQKNLGSFE